MGTQKLIAIKEFCVYHNLSQDFVRELHRNELIELVMIKRTGYIPAKNLQQIEKIIRLYHECNINIEGIQIVLQLLSNLQKKEDELNELKNQLAFYR